MQYSWLTKNLNNKNLIIFFAGWSFDSTPFEFLTSENNDIIVFYDYSNFDKKDLAIDFQTYENIYLVAWSMGVYVAEILSPQLPNFNKKIAINGTSKPIDNVFGIPEKTFALTLKFVDSGLKGKFYQNIFYEQENYEKYLKNPVTRSIENRAIELENLNNYIKQKPSSQENSNFYDIAYVSKFDKIIPPKNQINFWEKSGCAIINLETGHFPFYMFNSWSEIINAN